MSPVRSRPTDRRDFRDWCAYRVQVDIESAPHQTAAFEFSREQGNRHGVWIYGTKDNAGLRIGAVESVRVEDATGVSHRYTAISDVHYSPAGNSAAEPTVGGFRTCGEAAALLYGRWIERRGRFLAPKEPHE